MCDKLSRETTRVPGPRLTQNDLGCIQRQQGQKYLEEVDMMVISGGPCTQHTRLKYPVYLHNGNVEAMQVTHYQ